MYFNLKIKALIICFVIHFHGISSKIHLSCRNVSNSKTASSNQSEVVWDKLSTTPQEYQTLFCTRRCSYGAIIGNSSILGSNSTVECFDCECQRPACEIYGICCPDATDLNTTSRSITNDNQSAIIITSYKETTTFTPSSIGSPVVICDTKSSSNKSFLVIRSCSSSFRNNMETVRLCEKDVPDNETSLDIYGRVVDTSTDVTYFNRYCALCNGVQRPMKWQIVIKCNSFLRTYKAEDEDTMLRLALTDKGACYTRQDSVNGTEPFECYTDEYKINATIIRSCNTSDPGQLNDEDVARACSELKGTTYRVYGRFTSVYYQNIFCAICRMKAYPRVPKVDYCVDTKVTPAVSLFSLLLNPRPTAPEAKKKKICPDNSWSAPNSECQELHCTPGKRLQNGNCTTVFTNIKGLGYSLRFWLAPPGNLTNISIVIRSILTEVKQRLSFITEAFALGVKVKVIVPIKSSYDLSSSSVIWINAQIIASYNLTRDQFETAIIKYILKDSVEINLEENVNMTFSVRPSLMLGELHDKTICDADKNISLYNTSCNQTQEVSSLYSSFNTITKLASLFLNVTGTLTCSYLRLKKPDYFIYKDESQLPPRITVMIDLNGTELNLTEISDLNMMELDTDGVLNVCHEILDARLGEIKLAEPITLGTLSLVAQYYLSMICAGASVICLALTIVTYLRFSVLRSVAGINNTFLSLSLLVAQLSLVTSNHVTCPMYVCTTVGILTHFLWLWMFSWTFICSLHMFRVFSSKTAKLSTPKHGSTVPVTKTVICSLITPSLVVITVIVTSTLTSNTSGYGNKRCYLDSPLFVGTALIGPLAVIIMCNMLFFIITVINIRKVRMLKINRATEDYSNIYVYIKLSTLTGGFWIVGISAEATDNDVLRFISIALNGLQGVFIFLSYTCNKRVIQLYTPKSNLKPIVSGPQQNTEETHVD